MYCSLCPGSLSKIFCFFRKFFCVWNKNVFQGLHCFLCIFSTSALFVVVFNLIFLIVNSENLFCTVFVTPFQAFASWYLAVPQPHACDQPVPGEPSVNMVNMPSTPSQPELLPSQDFVPVSYNSLPIEFNSYDGGNSPPLPPQYMSAAPGSSHASPSCDASAASNEMAVAGAAENVNMRCLIV